VGASPTLILCLPVGASALLSRFLRRFVDATGFHELASLLAIATVRLAVTLTLWAV
jgi:hypothetical protein